MSSVSIHTGPFTPAASGTRTHTLRADCNSASTSSGNSCSPFSYCNFLLSQTTEAMNYWEPAGRNAGRIACGLPPNRETLGERNTKVDVTLNSNRTSTDVSDCGTKRLRLQPGTSMEENSLNIHHPVRAGLEAAAGQNTAGESAPLGKRGSDSAQTGIRVSSGHTCTFRTDLQITATTCYEYKRQINFPKLWHWNRHWQLDISIFQEE